MLTALFLRSLFIGLSIAAPVGPVGVLCIRRTLAQGVIFGLLSGLGAAAADAIYGIIATLGLSAVSEFLIKFRLPITVVGTIFLLYIGITTYRSKPATSTTEKKPSSLFGAFVSTFFLTLTNPMTILAFTAIMTSTGLTTTAQGWLPPLLLVTGVFLGSMAWWIFLCVGIGIFRSKFDQAKLVWANKISGIIVIVLTAYSVFRYMMEK